MSKDKKLYPDRKRNPAQAAYARQWRARNLEKAEAYRKANLEKRQLLLNRIKDVECLDCGGKFPPVAMDFDHVRGEKKFEISQKYVKLETLLDEIAKCEIVCANCHRVRTHLRRRDRL